MASAGLVGIVMCVRIVCSDGGGWQSSRSVAQAGFAGRRQLAQVADLPLRGFPGLWLAATARGKGSPPRHPFSVAHVCNLGACDSRVFTAAPEIAPQQDQHGGSKLRENEVFMYLV
jgi:hypothetical protein